MPNFDDEKQSQDSQGTKLYLILGFLILIIGGRSTAIQQVINLCDYK